MTPPGVLRRFLGGLGYLAKGFRTWGTSPGLMLLGLVPAAIVGLVYLAGVVLLLLDVGAIVGWATAFADAWVQPWRDLVRIAAGLAIVLLAIMLLINSFTAVTLAVGDPFYERIWRATERRLGDPVDDTRGFWKGVRQGLGTGIRLLASTALIALLVLASGLIPLVGPALAFTLGALFGGWFLALELSGFAFDARGLGLRDRRRMLGASRASTLGFGVATYLLFLVPLGAVIAMPAAVAGATMMARDAIERDRRLS